MNNEYKVLEFCQSKFFIWCPCSKHLPIIVAMRKTQMFEMFTCTLFKCLHCIFLLSWFFQGECIKIRDTLLAKPRTRTCTIDCHFTSLPALPSFVIIKGSFSTLDKPAGPLGENFAWSAEILISVWAAVQFYGTGECCSSHEQWMMTKKQMFMSAMVGRWNVFFRRGHVEWNIPS